jgi:hypothetical protein
LKKKVTWKGIAQSKFTEIGQTTAGEVKLGNEYYIRDIDNWTKNKITGVSI